MRDLFIAVLAALLDGQKDSDGISEWIERHYPTIEISDTQLQFLLDTLSEGFAIKTVSELGSGTFDVKIAYKLIEWKSSFSIDFCELTVL